jgi:hypothetical protein
VEANRRNRRVRLVVMGLHGLYIIALLGSAIGVLVYSFGDGVDAEWAAFDRILGSFMAAVISALAVAHALAAIAWFGGAPTRWVLATTVPVIVLIFWTWAGAQPVSIPGWGVAVAALLAGLGSALAPGPPQDHAAGANPAP